MQIFSRLSHPFTGYRYTMNPISSQNNDKTSFRLAIQATDSTRSGCIAQKSAANAATRSVRAVTGGRRIWETSKSEASAGRTHLDVSASVPTAGAARETGRAHRSQVEETLTRSTNTSTAFTAWSTAL